MDELPQNSSPTEQTTPADSEVMLPSPALEAPAPVSDVETKVHLSRLDRFWKLALIAILLLAISLRTRGLNWDEGTHLHPDERFLTMVETAIRLPSSLAEYFETTRSPLNPYNNNFSSFVYGTAPLFLVRLVGEVVGMTDYETMVLLGRALSALADVFVIAMTFAIGRRLYGRRVGLLAALLYTFSVLPIKQSHFFTVDTFTNVPLVLAFWFTLDIMEGKRAWRAFVLAGLFFGLMLASRINLAPFLGILVLAAFLRLLASAAQVQHIQVRSASDASPPPKAIGEPAPVRVFRIGPLLIEVEFKQPVPSEARLGTDGQDFSASPSGLWQLARPVVIGLVLAVVVAVLTFRIAQPYAFDGLLTLNPQFLEDMGRVQRLVSGEDDFPPSHQWTNRTPYWFPWYNMVVWGMGPALGIAAWLGVALAAYQVMRRGRRDHLLMLLWVLGMFLYHGQQFVLTMRYYLPLYPFLAIFGAFFLFEVWDRAKRFASEAQNNRIARGATVSAVLLFVVVIGATVFWALASTSIYIRTNTRVAASRWIYENIPDTAVIGNEHWDDTLPLRVDGKDYFRDHDGVMLELYGEDTPEKREKMIQWMEEVDYIILSSNRLYGSIPRLPMRFPLTTKYYEWLFNGQLGFEPVEEFTSYPQLLGIMIPDDRAEEAFTVYDHPKVIIFQKTPDYSPERIVELFNSVDLSEVLRIKPVDAAASRRQFQMSPAELAANRAGGTWYEIFDPGGLANRFPLPIWGLMVWLIGALTFPFTYVLFPGFQDRGYAFAKALGILFVAWFAWTLSSYRLLPFGRLPILLGILVMLLGSILVVRQRRHDLSAYVRANWRILLVEELIFFGFFGIDLFIRYQNPDLWHPGLGGEKPMDFAFLNAILKSTYFPPYNPWYAGSYINYYYFGQLISAVLVRLSGITPEIAYNLLIPLFFALTASGAFGVVFNLVRSGRERLASNHQGIGDSSIIVPVAAGIFGIVLVLVIGNLGEVKLLFKGLTELGAGSGLAGLLDGMRAWLSDGERLPIPTGDWYWTATRVIPNTINEFPFFTFLYGDLHAHLIAIPYTLLALGLATHLILHEAPLKWQTLGVIALVLGALRATNTWDYPTYLGVIGTAMILRLGRVWSETRDPENVRWEARLQQWLQFILVVFFQLMLVVVPLSILGIRVTLELAVYMLLLLAGVALGFSRAGWLWEPYPLLRRFGWPFIGILILSIILFLPYIYNYATGYVSPELWKDVRTTFREYITVHGIFLFLAATFLVVVFLTDKLRGQPRRDAGYEMTGWTVYLVPALALASLVLLVLGQPILALTLPIIALGIWITLRRQTPTETAWISTWIVLAILLTLIVEVIVLKGDIGRMNTVFKFYLQAWVLFGVAGAAGMGMIIDRVLLPSSREVAAETISPSLANSRPSTRGYIRRMWWGTLMLLVLAGLVYPFAATRAKMDDRYVSGSPSGLNGMDYMQAATYFENNQEVELRWDHEAMQWIRENVEGSPVIMEANTGLYHWGNRYSIYTGLPTVIGWDWHTKQQYSLLPSDLIDYRISLTHEFYNTIDQDRAAEIARRYDVSYVIVGGLERAVYDANGLGKFDGAEELWRLVYENEQVRIYEVQ
jgi:uncharacterized membrane protein